MDDQRPPARRRRIRCLLIWLGRSFSVARLIIAKEIPGRPNPPIISLVHRLNPTGAAWLDVKAKRIDTARKAAKLAHLDFFSEVI